MADAIRTEIVAQAVLPDFGCKSEGKGTAWEGKAAPRKDKGRFGIRKGSITLEERAKVRSAANLAMTENCTSSVETEYETPRNAGIAQDGPEAFVATTAGLISEYTASAHLVRINAIGGERRFPGGLCKSQTSATDARAWRSKCRPSMCISVLTCESCASQRQLGQKSVDMFRCAVCYHRRKDRRENTRCRDEQHCPHKHTHNLNLCCNELIRLRLRHRRTPTTRSTPNQSTIQEAGVAGHQTSDWRNGTGFRASSPYSHHDDSDADAERMLARLNQKPKTAPVRIGESNIAYEVRRRYPVKSR